MTTALKLAGWIFCPSLMLAGAIINCAFEWAELLGLTDPDADSID